MAILAVLVALALGGAVGYYHRLVVDELAVLRDKMARIRQQIPEPEPDKPISSLLEPQSEIEQEVARRDELMRRLNGRS